MIYVLLTRGGGVRHHPFAAEARVGAALEPLFSRQVAAERRQQGAVRVARISENLQTRETRNVKGY